MRALLSAVLAGAALLPAACSDGEQDGGEADEPAVTGEAGSATRPTSGTGNSVPQDALEGATPNEERVATLGLLNKRNNLSEDIELKPGESREIGPVIASCERTPPWEMPQETGAFVQVDVLERGEREHTRVFSGWLFKQSPSLNVVEHPLYDVWVKDCAMRFPGEEEGSAPTAVG